MDPALVAQSRHTRSTAPPWGFGTTRQVPDEMSRVLAGTGRRALDDHQASDPRPRWLSMKGDSGGLPDDQTRRDDPVDSGAEWRPPPGVGHILAAFLPEVFEPVAGVAGNEQPHRRRHAGRGEHHEDPGDNAFDGDDPRSSIGHREADIDRRDQAQ